MHPFFTFFKKIADSNWFQTFIILVIIIAGVLVGIQTYNIHETFKESTVKLLDSLDFIILVIFTIEVVVKVLAEGKKPWRYFMDPWNIFDFLIVAVAIVALFVPNMNAGFIAVLRLVRILRVFKLVTAIPKLQLLVGALIKSVPSMGYVGILLSLLFYIYAAMGVFFFGINDPIHFGDLHNSMLSLFRVVTLEDWTDVMYIQMHGCDCMWGYGPEEGCTNPQAFGVMGALFFVSFVMIGTMIVLNLFIGVIMNSMDEAKAEAEIENNAKLKEEDGVPISQDIHLISNKIDELKSEMDLIYARLKEKE